MAAFAARKPRSIASSQMGNKSPKWGGFVNVVENDYHKFDPFIFLVHHKHAFRPSEVTGFPGHPHRGFETVTYVTDGYIAHGDSRGNRGRYGPGDVQFLTAGKGILHSEMFVPKATRATTLECWQLWLNLPASLKLVEPSYDMIWAKDMPTATISCENQVKPMIVKVIMGESYGAKSKIVKSTPLSYLHVQMPPTAKFSQPTPADHNAFIYVFKGKAKVGNKEIPSMHNALFAADGDTVEIENANVEDLEFLFLEGKPFNEPFFHRGPFVANTQQEWMRGLMEYQSGKFGEMAEEDFVGEITDD